MYSLIPTALRFGLQRTVITPESVMPLAQVRIASVPLYLDGSVALSFCVDHMCIMQAPSLELPVWLREADQRKRRDGTEWSASELHDKAESGVVSCSPKHARRGSSAHRFFTLGKGLEELGVEPDAMAASAESHPSHDDASGRDHSAANQQPKRESQDYATPSQMHATLAAARVPKVYARGVLQKQRRSSIFKVRRGQSFFFLLRCKAMPAH